MNGPCKSCSHTDCAQLREAAPQMVGENSNPLDFCSAKPAQQHMVALGPGVIFLLSVSLTSVPTAKYQIGPHFHPLAAQPLCLWYPAQEVPLLP